MFHKLNSSSKTSTCRGTNSTKSNKSRVSIPRKKVLPSKKIPTDANDRKACSTGFIKLNEKAKPKKTTKSDFHVRKETEESKIDYCKNCGDAVCPNINNRDNKKAPSNNKRSESTSLNKSKTLKAKTNANPPKPVQQYYKNENYRPSTESLADITMNTKKISLDTIKEVSEMQPSESIFNIYPDSDEEITFLDTDDRESLERLKEFRQKNYFECHSAKSRVKNRGSATSLRNHICVYRFYLNDRLFPVPLSTDHNNQIRCVECHLPMELNVDEDDEGSKVNGTIQAKITLGKKNQDIMLLLPVKEPLIITEKRKEEKKEKEVLFFGVINLNEFGNSIFNSTLPSNSFALKYQKGYKEFESKEEYSYRDFDKADVIVI